MYLIFEQERRGGFSGILGSRKVIAKNKSLIGCDIEKLTNFIHYLDANNVYGLAMSQKLPTRNFKWQYNENFNINQIRQDHIALIIKEGIPFFN